MTEREALERAASLQGWDDASIRQVLLDYIENQASPEAFADYLTQTMEREDTATTVRETSDLHARLADETLVLAHTGTGWIGSFRLAMTQLLDTLDGRPTPVTLTVWQESGLIEVAGTLASFDATTITFADGHAVQRDDVLAIRLD